MSNWDYLNTRRIKTGFYASTPEDGFNGAFMLSFPGEARAVFVLCSDGLGWQHASVSFGRDCPHKTPSWEIMCQVKDLFWEPEDWVVQFHPARSSYVNTHPGCLHLWKPIGVSFPVPDPLMVGIPNEH